MRMEDRDHDSLFGALADPRRRQICRSIACADEPVVTLEELAGAVEPADEPNSTSHASETWSPQDARTTLHHVHLPKLAEAGVVEYSPEERSVGTGEAFPLALDLLRTIEDAQPDANASASR